MASVFRRITKSGKPEKVWRFKYKDYAGRWRYGTGWPDKQKTLRHANDVEAEHRAIRNGEKPLPSPRRLLVRRPIGEVMLDYLAWGRTQGGRGGRPWDGQNASLKEGYLRWWIDELKLKLLAEIRLDDVEKVVQKMLKSGHYAPKSVALRVEALRSFCLWSVRRGYFHYDPLAGLTKIDARPRDPHRALTDDEVARLLAVAPPHRRLWYEVALATGYRVSELRALRVRDLDLSGPSLPLGADFTKNRKNARQPITRELAQKLLESTRNGPEDAPLLDIPLQKAWKNLKCDLVKAGISATTDSGKASWHSLRKCFVNAVVRSGADLKTVMELARHSTAALSMEVYASTDAARLRQAAEAASQHMKKAISDAACCKCVENPSRPKKDKVITQRKKKTYRGIRMVGATGFEPAAS